MESESHVELRLNWEEATDDRGGAVRYLVYQNGVQLGAAISAREHTIPLGTQTGWMRWQIRPLDHAGNIGPVSNIVEREVTEVVEAPLRMTSRRVSGSKSAWGEANPHSTDQEILHYSRRVETKTFLFKLTRDFENNTRTRTHSGNITETKSWDTDGNQTVAVRGDISGNDLQNYANGNFLHYIDEGDWGTDSSYSGTSTTTDQNGTNTSPTDSPPWWVDEYSGMAALSVATETRLTYDYNFASAPVSGPNPNDVIEDMARRVVTYSEPVTRQRIESALRPKMPSLSDQAWGNGAASSSRSWSPVGSIPSLTLEEAEYKVRVDDSATGARYRIRWLEVFFPANSEAGQAAPSALALREAILSGNGDTVESEPYFLAAPDEEGAVSLVPVDMALDVPFALAVNDNFDERLADSEAEWVPDLETPSPLRADGTIALNGMTPLWLGSNGSGSVERFGPETRGVRLTVVDGGERIRLHATAPAGTGENAAYTEADWRELESGEELVGSVYHRRDEDASPLPDWTIYAEGLAPGKVTLRLDVDRYGEVLSETRTLFVIRTDLVARDRSTGEVAPLASPAHGGTPTPHVEMAVESAHIEDGRELVVNVAGQVRDPLSELMSTPALRLQSLSFQVNGRTVGGITNLPSLAGGGATARPWQPASFTVPFTRTLRIPVHGPGPKVIRAQTSPNAAGQRGWADVVVHVSRQTYTTPPPALAPAFFQFAATPSSSAVDEVRVILGVALPSGIEPVLTETAPASGVFEGMIEDGGVERPAVLALALPAASPLNAPSLDGRLAYLDASGQAREIAAAWAQDSADANLYRTTRMLPPEGVRTALTISGSAALGGTSDEGFITTVLRIDGLQEADDENGLPLSVGNSASGTGSETGELRSFVFSPEYHYLVNIGQPNAPRLLIASSPVLYRPEEQIETLKAGRNAFALHVSGRPAVEGTSVEILNGGSGGTAGNANAPTVAYLQDVFFWYDFLFDRPELPKIGNLSTPLYLLQIFSDANCAYELVDDPEVTGTYFRNTPSRLVIKVGRETDPVTAAFGLYDAYQSLLYTAPIHERLVADGAPALDLLQQRNTSIKTDLAVLREIGLVAYEAQFSLVSEPLDVVFSLNEVATGNMYGALGVIPGLPSGVSKLVVGSAVAGAAGQLILKGQALQGFRSYISEIKPLLRKSKRFTDRVLGYPGAKARIIFMKDYAHLLTRDQLRIMYDDLSVLRSDKNRSVLADSLTNAGRPKPGINYTPHHDLPLEFERDFILAGLDPNDPAYGRWIHQDIHAGWSNGPGTLPGGPFNDAWRKFLRDSDGHPVIKTRAEILEKMEELRAGKFKT